MKEVDLSKLQVHRNASFALAHNRQSRLRWWHGAVAAVVVAGVAWLVHPPAQAVQGTRVVMAYPVQQYVQLNATGYVVARRKASVASKGTGRLEWLGVTEGSVVKAGEVVARLESRDVEATLQNAVANVAVAAAAVASANTELGSAQTNYRRMQDLLAKHYVSQILFDDAKARYDRATSAVRSAEAALEAARANENYARNALDYTRITAPFDGVVIAKSANVGDVVTPLSSAAESKGAVVVMADMSTLEVDADVSESALSSIRLQQPCELVLDAFPERRFHGEVSTIVPTINRSSATVTVKVRILDVDPRILPDMSARVSFLSQAATAADDVPVTAVNPQVIAQRDGRSVVYRIVLAPGENQQGVVQQLAVQPGLKLGEVQAISANVQAGDTLVLNPSERLRDGARIVLSGDR